MIDLDKGSIVGFFGPRSRHPECLAQKLILQSIDWKACFLTTQKKKRDGCLTRLGSVIRLNQKLQFSCFTRYIIRRFNIHLSRKRANLFSIMKRHYIVNVDSNSRQLSLNPPGRALGEPPEGKGVNHPGVSP